MQISKEEVLKVASLAGLELEGDEISFFQNDLGRIFDYINKLETFPSPEGKVDCVDAAASEERPDQSIEAAFDFAALQAVAPDMAGRAFRVPRIVD